MFRESDYIHTVRSGVVTIGVRQDEAAAYDCPLDWNPRSIACMPLDGDDLRELERLGDAAEAVGAARYHSGDPEAAALEAFTLHHSRKGWAVGIHTLTGDCPGDRVTVALAVEPGFGTPEADARELED